MKRLLSLLLVCMMLVPCCFAEETAATQLPTEITDDSLAIGEGLIISMLANALSVRDYNLTVALDDNEKIDLVLSSENEGAAIQLVATQGEAELFQFLFDLQGFELVRGESNYQMTWNELNQSLIAVLDTIGINASMMPTDEDSQMFATLAEMIKEESEHSGNGLHYISDGENYHGYFTFHASAVKATLIRVVHRFLSNDATAAALDSFLSRYSIILNTIFSNLLGSEIDVSKYTSSYIREHVSEQMDSGRAQNKDAELKQHAGQRLEIFFGGNSEEHNFEVLSFKADGSRSSCLDVSICADGTIEGWSEVCAVTEEEEVQYCLYFDGVYTVNTFHLDFYTYDDIPGFVGGVVDAFRDEETGEIHFLLTDNLSYIRMHIKPGVFDYTMRMGERYSELHYTTENGYLEGHSFRRGPEHVLEFSLNKD